MNEPWTKPHIDNAALKQTPLGAVRVVIGVPCRECGINTVQTKLANGNTMCWCGCENTQTRQED